MKRAIVFACALLIGALVSAGALAMVPDLIPVQGVLADADGAPLDGAYDLTFSLYDTEGATTPLWTGMFEDVDVAEGFFTVYLGSGTALDFASLISNPEIWLGMTVESDPEMNRIQLAAVPFAIEAQVCEAVGTLTEEDINANFAPVDHDHGGVYAAAIHKHLWADITDIPSDFADGVDNVNDTVSWSEISGIVGTAASTVAAGDHDHDADYAAIDHNHDEDYVTPDGAQTLTNKTLTSPVINSPTGLVKADVGLENVANVDTTDAANISSGTLAIARGGTGAATAADAANNLMPAQGGNAGKLMGTDGTNLTWTSSLSNLTVAGAGALFQPDARWRPSYQIMGAGTTTLNHTSDSVLTYIVDINVGGAVTLELGYESNKLDPWDRNTGRVVRIVNAAVGAYNCTVQATNSGIYRGGDPIISLVLGPGDSIELMSFMRDDTKWRGWVVLNYYDKP